DAAAPVPTILPALLNPAIALLLAGRGYHVLHGGAVAVGGDCAAILGAPGAGKSSLVLACARQGLEIVSDELVPFRRRGSSFRCPGSNPMIRVDAALLGRGRRGEPIAGARGRKVALDVRRVGGRLADGPRRLAALVFVDREH